MKNNFVFSHTEEGEMTTVVVIITASVVVAVVGVAVTAVASVGVVLLAVACSGELPVFVCL
jgi:hypothetical protein